jgi:anti-sigma B factor antagonist
MPEMPELGISLIEEEGRTVLVVDGEVDITTAGALANAISAAAAASSGDLIVDVAGVTFLDSTGIKILLQGSDALVERGRRLVLRKPQAPVHKTLEVVGVLTTLGVDGAS